MLLQNEIVTSILIYKYQTALSNSMIKSLATPTMEKLYIISTNKEIYALRDVPHKRNKHNSTNVMQYTE